MTSANEPRISPRAAFDWTKTHPSSSEHFQRFPSRRSPVFGTRGMVASSQPLATSAGIKILDMGGNAADAAVAVAAALNLTEPCSTGIGGDAFCLFFDAKTKKVKALNGSGRTPMKLDLKKCRELGFQGNEFPLTDINTATVPGAPGAWVDTVNRLGSGKVTMEQILEPAIRMAEKGFPVNETVAYSWQRSEELLKKASPNSAELLKDGVAPKSGEIMYNPTLAQTFRSLAKDGKEGFYKGRIAEAIVELHQSLGGTMELSDLESHIQKNTEVDPISYTYNSGEDGEGVTIWECPPSGQGLVALLALGLLDSLQSQGMVKDLSKMEHNSAEYLHALIEALRLAFSDARYHVADPEHHDVPVKDLLSKQYLDERAKKFSSEKAGMEGEHGNPKKTCDTVYFSVTDEDGNACSFINSNYAGFGTGAIPEGCGFTLQNRGAGFFLVEGHPNCVAPGKRPYHTIIPAMATKGNELYLSYGVMGGFMQPQGHVQVLLSLLHHHMTVQSALDAPRFCIGSGMPDAGPINSDVFLEEGIDEKVVEKLREMGHNVKVLTGWQRGQFGRGQVIQKVLEKNEATGERSWSWAGGSDMRADGQAVAQV